jgi:hypothetical protein
MTMCHASFLAAAWKMYTLPPDWFYDLTVFRLVLGVGMIALHLWTAASIYDSLGEFGWFCGDFFFDPPPKNLTYSGIYRFLNRYGWRMGRSCDHMDRTHLLPCNDCASFESGFPALH